MLRLIGGITALMLSASIVTAQQPGAARPDRRGMSGQNQMAMATMDSLNQRLDSLVGRMNRASGNQKVQAMAAVINEMVAQRKAMQERMHHMMGGDGMMKMMGDSAAVRPGAGAQVADSAASDTAGHEGHHPPQ